MPCPACGTGGEETCPVCSELPVVGRESADLIRFRVPDPPGIAERVRVINVRRAHDLGWGDPCQSFLVCTRCGHGWPNTAKLLELLTECPRAP